MSGYLGKEEEKEKGTERDSMGQGGHDHGVRLEYTAGLQAGSGWPHLAGAPESLDYSLVLASTIMGGQKGSGSQTKAWGG